MPEPAAAAPQAEDEAALYEVAPERFIAARAALVKRLRSDGRPAEAAHAAKLRRPPLTAWALNQVARAAPELIAALHQAGDGLRRAMGQALAGDGSGLRPARADERAAVDAIVAAAERTAQDAGYSTTDVMRQRMAATLRAAIVDEQVATRFREGMLEADHEAPGFGMDALTVNASRAESPSEAGSPPEAESSADSPAVTSTGPACADLKRRRELARGEAQRAAAEADALGAEAERLAAEADRLAAEADRLAAEAKQSSERSAQARGRAEEVRRLAARHEAEVDLLTQQLESLAPGGDRKISGGATQVRR